MEETEVLLILAMWGMQLLRHDARNLPEGEPSLEWQGVRLGGLFSGTDADSAQHDLRTLAPVAFIIQPVVGLF